MSFLRSFDVRFPKDVRSLIGVRCSLLIVLQVGPGIRSVGRRRIGRRLLDGRWAFIRLNGRIARRCTFVGFRIAGKI